MQYGIPVVATAQGGALEMIAENETGIFIPIDDVTIATNKIYQLLQKKGQLAMKEKCIQRVNQYFSITAFENNIANLFHS
jgi:glycosyltransferase involved in cell wall biosynthesis